MHFIGFYEKLVMFVDRKNLAVLLISSIVAVAVLISILIKILHYNVEKQEIRPITRIAVINSTRLKSEALCFRANDKLEAMLSDVIARMHDSESKAKAEYEKTKNDRTLEKKQMSKKIEQIEEDWNKVSQKYKKEVESIKKMDANLSNMLQEKLNDVIINIVKKYKIDIVFNTRILDTISVFYAARNIDITDIVIKSLNRVIPNVDMERLKQ
jgi:Skp family chaperone for outer membrane proteins